MFFIVRLIKGLNDMTTAVAVYKTALHEDNMCVEAIACIATHYFYSDQPEIALKFYRSVLVRTLKVFFSPILFFLS